MIGGLAGYWSWPRQPSGPVTGAPRVSTKPVAANPPATLAESQSSGSPSHAAGTRREDFLPHLKSIFQLDSAPPCTLVEVSAAQKMIGPTAEFTSFSLLFSAPNDFAAESKIYHLTHGQMGTLDLFLSPVGRSKDQIHLEAVCSQRV